MMIFETIDIQLQAVLHHHIKSFKIFLCRNSLNYSQTTTDILHAAGLKFKLVNLNPKPLKSGSGNTKINSSSLQI